MKATTTSGGTPARQKMIATMDMKGLSLRTQDNYLRSVSALARFYDRPPQTLSAEEVGAWVLGRIAAGRCPRTTNAEVSAPASVLCGHHGSAGEGQGTSLPTGS